MTTSFATPAEVRRACRRDELDVFPSTTIDGFLCLNLVMMERVYAEAFAAFCAANPIACPLIATTEPGDTQAPTWLAQACNLTTDLRSYDIIRDGIHHGSQTRVDDLFTSDMVCFLIGSSVSFDGLLSQRGWQPSWGPCIYLTNQACTTAGPFAGNLAVTMRTFPTATADAVSEFTRHFPRCHGGPLSRNDPAALGINDEMDQHLAWPGPIPANHDRLYWACGITPSRVALAAKLPLMIVHTPGNALVSDLPTMDLYEELPSA